MGNWLADTTHVTEEGERTTIYSTLWSKAVQVLATLLQAELGKRGSIPTIHPSLWDCPTIRNLLGFQSKRALIKRGRGASCEGVPHGHNAFGNDLPLLTSQTGNAYYAWQVVGKTKAAQAKVWYLTGFKEGLGRCIHVPGNGGPCKTCKRKKDNTHRGPGLARGSYLQAKLGLRAAM